MSLPWKQEERILDTDKPTPRISVIIPCHNSGRYLWQAARSILKQTYQNWECIIVNDGSMDETKDVAVILSAEDVRFRFVEQSNCGLPAARNRGIKESHGEFLQFLDADDLITPRKFMEQIEFIESHNSLDVVYSGYACFSDDDASDHWTYSSIHFSSTKPVFSFIWEWERRNRLSIPIHSFLFRRSCFDRWGGFDESLPNHEDWDLYIRFLLAGAKFRLVNSRRTALYRKDHGSMTSSFHQMQRGKRLVMLKYIDNQDIPVFYRLLLMIRYTYDCIDMNEIKKHLVHKKWKDLFQIFDIDHRSHSYMLFFLLCSIPMLLLHIFKRVVK